MKEVWKELQQRCEEEQPLAGGASSRGKPQRSRGGAAGKSRAVERVEPDFFDSGFTLREISVIAVRIWLALQFVGLYFQFQLWREVSDHLTEFEEAVARECSPERLQHGVCHGALWNVTSRQDFVLGGGHAFTTSHTFKFVTQSSPPTFLVVVDPVSKAKRGDGEPEPAPDILAEQETNLRDIHWVLDVSRTAPPHTGPPLIRRHFGQESLTFEDLSTESRQALAAAGRVEWRATVSARLPRRLQSVGFAVVVEDAATPHLAEIHASPQCAFGRSWKAFNQQHEGHSHKALSWCQSLLLIFLFVGAGAVYLVHSELTSVTSGQKRDEYLRYRFHAVVAAKFLLQDAPQQVCVVLYVLGWYEAAGLRCQLCMFHPEHCSAEDAFHFANCVSFACTLLSSVSNQLLVRPVVKKVYTEDDLCVQYLVRIGGACLATVPFTTGILMASRSVLPVSTLLHVVVAGPCLIGWLTLAALVCLPCSLCCEDDLDF